MQFRELFHCQDLRLRDHIRSRIPRKRISSYQSVFFIIGTKIAKFFLIFFAIYQKMHIFAIPNRKLRFPKGRTTLR